jgi:hypothetical protein
MKNIIKVVEAHKIGLSGVSNGVFLVFLICFLSVFAVFLWCFYPI